MRIEEQQAVAHAVLKKLRVGFPDTVLAGGAVRDWYFGQEAKDLDFFIPKAPSKEAIEDALGFLIEPAAKGDYPKGEFTTYNIIGLEMPVQVMSCSADDSQEIIEGFPCNLSKAWYDGEEFHYDPFFLLGVKYGYIIGEPGPLVDKVFRKYPGFKYWAYHNKHFFECIGEKRKPAEPPRGLRDINGGMLGANADWFLFDDLGVEGGMGIGF